MSAPAWKVNKVVFGVLATFVLIYGTVVASVVSVVLMCHDSCSAQARPIRLKAWCFLQIIPWLSFSVPGVTNLLVLTINATLALSCFVACVIADSGR